MNPKVFALEKEIAEYSMSSPVRRVVKYDSEKCASWREERHLSEQYEWLVFRSRFALQLLQAMSRIRL